MEKKTSVSTSKDVSSNGNRHDEDDMEEEEIRRKAAARSSRFWNKVIEYFFFFVGFVFLRNAIYAKDPLVYMMPNALLLTPWRGLTEQLFARYVVYPEEVYEPQPVNEMDASEYSFEKLRKMTDNFRHPGVVRGLFRNTTGVQRWPEPGYLKGQLDEIEIPVIQKGYHNHVLLPRATMDVGDAIDKILLNRSALHYMFFPAERNADPRLKPLVTELARQDLEFDRRIFPGFGNKWHFQFKTAQLLIGNGFANQENTTGSYWHCAIPANFFIQVAGQKVFRFIDPIYSAYLQPRRGGVYYMTLGKNITEEHISHLPVKHTELVPGDMLFVPAWYWHAVYNREGLAIGTPLREANITGSFANNALFSSIAFINIFLANFGIAYGHDTTY